jgi:hypothetical protein
LFVDGRANFLASALGIFFTAGRGLDFDPFFSKVAIEFSTLGGLGGLLEIVGLRFGLTFGLLGHDWESCFLLQLSGWV